ncbi:hypothetical protein D910_08019 [Dendroctonus ponderosae]|uniref:Uncharacterized protein n=1 Tax=Dendroctonus ponderosae TaxID=77166 RepID=U4UC88_DENPD|nr:hypothetical protein D910_08019 [Dendroctonus ponderosae]
MRKPANRGEIVQNMGHFPVWLRHCFVLRVTCVAPFRPIKPPSGGLGCPCWLQGRLGVGAIGNTAPNVVDRKSKYRGGGRAASHEPCSKRFFVYKYASQRKI